ncbi:GNAT family N-acetyltransferase [Streptococcus pluranimalium]|uniref:GNAT family N-acetyltransferase n=1 Tax=Streptococcus hyovaginalis TaxID=149015 RepID=UPI003AEA4236
MEQIIDYNSWLGNAIEASKSFHSGVSNIDNYLQEELVNTQNDVERRLLLYVEGERILGFVSFSIVQFKVTIQNKNSIMQDPVIYINGLGVDLSRQRNKIGSKLLEIVFKTALTINVLAPIKGVRLTAYREATDFYDSFEFDYLGRKPEEDFNSKEFPMYMDIDFIDKLGFEPFYNIFEVK